MGDLLAETSKPFSTACNTTILPFMEDLFLQLPKISIDSVSHTVYLPYSKLFHAGQSRKRGLGGFTGKTPRLCSC